MTLYPAFILVLSFILAVYSGQYADIFYSFLRITAFFILPVFAFSAYLFSPVLSYLKKEREYDTLVGDRVKDLTLLTVALFFLTALFYSLINLLFMKFSYESVFSFNTVLRVINRNCVMGTIFTYFLADSFSIYLKEKLFESRGIIFPPQKNSIMVKLLIAFAGISLSPLLEIYYLVSPYLEDIDGIILVQISVISTMLVIMIIISAVMITGGIKRPMSIILRSFRAAEEGNFSHIPVTSDDESGVIAENYNRMLTGLKERDFIRDTFGKFVTKEVASEILKGSEVLQTGLKKKITVMFTDIENYTSITEDMQPEEVVEMLNEYFTIMVSIIRKHKGVVNKFIGDAVMAFFNAPANDDDHADNAVKAALEINEYVKTHRFLKGTKELKTRIGINTDQVVVGSIGSTDRLEYTVIGDGVNVSSRLEGLNKQFGTYIMAGENTFSELKEIYGLEEITETRLKGKDKPTRVYGIKTA
ncbi:MAG: adenylate/guanylate cyclase domain-containing protein [Candidatus Delongbacteria bacterium]